ncbi:MAG: tryptophan--tRNA ligase, partial [Candidatus Latescibacteria bacterium]|nr:tryptophan--tRNA ligase [Candidatus Latescibacterota bacterium]
MPRLFSGIQPTGEPHLGNYFGAFINWVALQEQYDAIYCIVDYHAITQDYDTDVMPQMVWELAAILLSCEINPDKCTLFVQSHIPQHTELAWVYSTVAQMGRLTNMTQFKEKSQDQAENINLGLLAYPVLQAADILLYKAEAVPVGEDQLQHLELTREIARKYNARFGETFPEPKGHTTKTPKVLGLDGERKMSKSLGNQIGLLDSSETVWQKLAPAPTDSARIKRTDPGDPKICNIFSYHGLISPSETVAWADEGCRSAGIGCIDCKKALAKEMDTLLGPIQARYSELEAKPDDVRVVLEAGAAKCRPVAEETMEEVRGSMGLNLVGPP